MNKAGAFRAGLFRTCEGRILHFGVSTGILTIRIFRLSSEGSKMAEISHLHASPRPFASQDSLFHFFYGGTPCPFRRWVHKSAQAHGESVGGINKSR